jgi:hypothetical protein
MPPDHPALTSAEVIADGGWHPRYARVLAIASDGDYGFALVDGNGDGAELEAEAWIWDDGTWSGAGSFGAGPLDNLGSVRTAGHLGPAYFAYGSAPGRQTITIGFDGHHHQVPVSRDGAWAFIKIRTETGGHESLPQPLDKNMGTPPG